MATSYPCMFWLGGRETEEWLKVFRGDINTLSVQVAVDMDFDREMFKLHTRVNKGETILGW